MKNCTYYYFDGIIKTEDFDFGNILLVKKPYKNNFIHNISCKTLIGAKPLQFRFSKEDEFLRFSNRTRYLLLFCPEKYDVIYNRIRYLISQKMVLHMFFLIFMEKIEIDLSEFLSLVKTLPLRYVIIKPFKSVRNKK